MADNYLEYHREEYEKKKSIWLQKKKRLPKNIGLNFSQIEKPADEAL